MTLDGVMQTPGYDEHPDGKNAWALQQATDDMQRYKIEELFAVDALLLGRVTYQIWAAFWRRRIATRVSPTGSTRSRSAWFRRP
jgi:dihydrofolate reductase